MKRHDEDEKEQTSEDYLAKLKALDYAFRMNECNDEIEVNGYPITDPLRSEIRVRMQDAGFKRMGLMEDSYIAHALHNSYHPIKEYLWSLKPDGEDYISAVAECFRDKHRIFALWFRKWLIGSVARVCEDGLQNPMLVLDGGQGIGKSYFARWLAGGMPNYFIEAPIHPDDKDDVMRLASVWIWEVAELGSTARRTDREALKHFISSQTIQVRKAYGRYDTRKPALASFLGTVNNESGLLSDPTGNRRFLICHVDKLDWAYSGLDVNQLWAQAMALYKSGETNRLDCDGESKANSINSEYEIDDPILGMLEKYFVIEPANEDLWLSSTDILETLNDKGLEGNSRSNAMGLAVAATKLGLVKAKRENGNGRRVWGYLGVCPT